MSITTDLTSHTEPDRTALNVQLAHIPSTTIYIDLQPIRRPVRGELPEDYEVSELDRPKLDEALRQIYLVHDYVDAQIISMVKQNIAVGEFSSEASAECQKYYTAECTLRYWMAEYPRFTQPWIYARYIHTMGFPINLSDFTIDDLLRCLQNIGAPEVMEASAL